MTLPMMVNIPQENTSYMLSFYSLLTTLMATPLSPLSLLPPAPFLRGAADGGAAAINPLIH